MIHFVAFFLLWGLFVFTESTALVAIAAVAYIFTYGIFAVSFSAGIDYQKNKDREQE